MSQTSVLRPATRPLAPTRLLAVALGEAAQRGPADQQAARNLVIAVDASDVSCRPRVPLGTASAARAGDR
jgi:hypothetical protein